MTVGDLEALHAALVERLETDEAIRRAFAVHPRHHFVPDMIWPDALGLPLFRTSDPDRWACSVYGGDAVTTQANDGESGPRNEPSSSSSAPQVMADMIAAARIEEGMRVLEIGTGTGWNAAVLASLVGRKGAVTSVEVDPRVAAHARERLIATGVDVRTANGPPVGEVFDAIIATCAVTRVPDTWSAALVENGPLVLPWSPRPDVRSTPVVALTKRAGRLRGAFLREATFMRDRTQRVEHPPFPGLGRTPGPAGVVSVGSVEMIGAGNLPRLQLMMPGVRLGAGVRPFQGGHGRIVWMGDGEAWAYVWPDGSVTGEGERALGRESAEAHRLLADAGVDGMGAFTLEVAPERDAYRVACAALERWWDHPVGV
ncbi:methyltransferase domain-containing protein [Nocardiopsis sp. MG754419]|uniref:methyltransferase domain-containing protein n=1 Tax=Nocardiopsis sp. MG754419 TaxID=2259865 RepID=UPI001BA5C3A9|nr:methyltransferase domain-containing protein [Nocardiopsis sp. MG754419]MBR8745089.1 protein-L-isoaspartate(D-aspartate) O-methyltransferase [Nocardiopsis sp. MG754419]